MRCTPLLTVLIAIGLGSGCSVDLEPPEGVRLTCAGDADCPEPLICHAVRRVCVSRGEQPPVIESVTVTVSERPTATRKVAAAGDSIRIEVKVNEPLRTDPSVRLVWLDSERAAPRTAVSGDGLTFTHALIVAADDPEGFANIVVSVEDSAGLTTETELTSEVEIDRTAPALVEAASSLHYVPGPGNPLPEVTAATDGTAVRLFVAVSEELALPPEVQAAPPTATALPVDTLLTSEGTFFVLELGPAAWPEDGTYRVSVIFTDVAGNVSPQTVATSLAFEVDATADAIVPDVDTPGTITFERIPWGAEATLDALSGAMPARFTLSGIAGAATPAATILVLDGPDAQVATEVARTVARSDGAFGAPPTDSDPFDTPPDAPLTLPLKDRDALWLLELDAAGNRGPAARVRDGSWTATLNGHQPGATTGNPNTLWIESTAPKTALSRTRREVGPSDVAAASRPDADQADPTTVAETVAVRSWAQRAPQTPHGALAGNMVYQAESGEVLVYGAGRDLSDTIHLWDGQEWRSVQVPGVTPGARFGAAMTFDSVRNRAVLFGGALGPGQSRGDTWEWTGSGWLDRTPYGAQDPTPGARFGAEMAFDAATGRSLLFGGLTLPDANGDCPTGSASPGVASPACYYTDTWAWDGTAWQVLCVDDCGPPGRIGHTLTHDPGRGVTMMFAGCQLAADFGCSGGRLEDTWLFDGATWNDATPSPPPAVRPSSFMHSAAYVDQAVDTGAAIEGRVVLYGGCTGGGLTMCSGAQPDLWAWDATAGAWEMLDPGPGGSPEGRSGAAVAYDRLRNELVMLGGSTVLPGGETCNTAVADANDLGGGIEQCIYRDTWTWSLAAGWQVSARPSSEPDGRRGAGAAFLVDPAGVKSGQSLFFSGLSELGQCDGEATEGCPDLWSWDGRSWVQRCGSRIPTVDCSTAVIGEGRPAPRSGSAMASIGSSALLFGGFAAGSCAEPDQDCGYTWQWDFGATAWTRFTPTVNPSPRTGAAVAYDPLRDRVVMFGGQVTTSTCPSDYTTGAATDCVACDVLEWDPQSLDWTRVWPTLTTCAAANGATGPVPRVDAAMTYMPYDDGSGTAGSVLLHGGCIAGSVTDSCDVGRLDDLWRWNGSSWTKLRDVNSSLSENGPGRRTEHRMVYDTWRGRVVLDAGRALANNASTWEWNGDAWSALPVSGLAPFLSDDNATVYDAERRRMVVYAAGNTTALWELDLSPALRPALTFEVAVGASNSSGDGPVADDLLTLQVVIDAAAEGAEDDAPSSTPALPIVRAAGKRGVRLEGFDNAAQVWRLLADNCTDAPDEPPAVRRLTASIGDPAAFIAGTPGRAFLRVIPCRGSGSRGAVYSNGRWVSDLARVQLDYIEATVTYRLP